MEAKDTELPWLTEASKAEVKRAVEALYRVHTLMGALTDLNALLERIGEESRRVAGAEAASVMLYDEAANELYFQVALGDQGNQETLKREVRLKMGQGIAGSAAAARASIVVNDVRQDPRFFGDADTMTAFHTRNVLAVPMLDHGRLVGVLEVLNKVGEAAFSPLDTHVTEMFSSMAAAAVSNAQLIEQQIRNERLAAIGQAIAGLTHHIKNIITGLNSSAELIEMARAKANQAMIDRTWPVLKRSVQRISNFVQDLLAFSKPRIPVRCPCNIEAVIREAGDSVQDLFHTKKVELIIEVEPLCAPVYADPDGLYRCLLNLIHNAAEAVPSVGGQVVITSHTRADEALEIDVSDNGPGVPAAVREQLFVPFFSTKGTAGTGLGLATTAKIVQEHGGGIELIRAEQGACFRIVLPRYMPDEEDTLD